MERVPIDYTVLCCAWRIPHRPVSGNLVWICRREMGKKRRWPDRLMTAYLPWLVTTVLILVDYSVKQPYRTFVWARLMSTQRVIVTYSAPQPFLSSDQWTQLHGALSAQLPLRNIHWKPQTRPSIRTIQELDVQLVPLNSVRDENTSQVPYSLLEKPLLNVYVVLCEVKLDFRRFLREFTCLRTGHRRV